MRAAQAAFEIGISAFCEASTVQMRSLPARAQMGICHSWLRCSALGSEPSGKYRSCDTTSFGAAPHDACMVTSGTPLWSRKVEKAGSMSVPASAEMAEKKSFAVAFAYA